VHVGWVLAAALHLQTTAMSGVQSLDAAVLSSTQNQSRLLKQQPDGTRKNLAVHTK
jgi:hypothetical protein